MLETASVHCVFSFFSHIDRIQTLYFKVSVPGIDNNIRNNYLFLMLSTFLTKKSALQREFWMHIFLGNFVSRKNKFI